MTRPRAPLAEIERPENVELVPGERSIAFINSPGRFDGPGANHGIQLRYRMNDRRILVNGWFDTNHGIYGGSIHLGHLIRLMDIPFDQVVKACAEAGDPEALAMTTSNFREKLVMNDHDDA